MKNSDFESTIKDISKNKITSVFETPKVLQSAFEDNVNGCEIKPLVYSQEDKSVKK